MFVSLRACARMRVRVYIKERVSFWLQRWFMKDLHKKEKTVFDDADQKNTNVFTVGVCLSNDLRKEIDCIESLLKNVSCDDGLQYEREQEEKYQKQFYACCKYLLGQTSASHARLQKECCDNEYLRAGRIIDVMKQEGVLDVFQKVNHEKMKDLVRQIENGRRMD